MPAIFHFAYERDWLAAQESGAYRVSTRDRTLDDEGFIHCSDAHQVARIANAVYADVIEPLVVLVIAAERLDAEVRHENLDGGSELFPHVYGGLPVHSVTSVTTLQRDSAGRYIFGEQIP